MPLNKTKGNMFDFITHTWNPIKGACSYNCLYCYMKKWGEGRLKTARFVESEMKTNLGENNFIFIGSSIDIFGYNIDHRWLADIFCKAIGYKNNYLLQTKNPKRYINYLVDLIPSKFVLSTTIETNYHFPEIMNNSPDPYCRSLAMNNIPKDYRKMVTIEPIMKFDLSEMVAMVMSFDPEQINIGADTLKRGLPEPTAKEVLKLIEVLEKYKRIKIKPNLNRILKQGAK